MLVCFSLFSAIEDQLKQQSIEVNFFSLFVIICTVFIFVIIFDFANVMLLKFQTDKLSACVIFHQHSIKSEKMWSCLTF